MSTPQTESLSFAWLKSRALIVVGGPDWRSFLQGLITQDVETLAPGEARFGALLTPQGRLLYDLFVVGREDGCWLDVLGEHRAAIIQRLMMYRLRAKVEIAADDSPVAILFSRHPRAGGDPGCASESSNSAWIPASVGMSGWVRDPRLPDLGWRGYGVEPPPGAAVVDESARDAAKLELGVPGPADWSSD